MKNIDIYKIKTIFHFFQIESTDVPLYLRMSPKDFWPAPHTGLWNLDMWHLIRPKYVNSYYLKKYFED